MSVRFALIASLLMTAAASARAQDTSPTPPTAKPVKEHKICRQDVDTGSIIPKNICHTKDEWAAIDADNAKNSRQFSDSLRDHSSGFGH